MKRRNNKFQEVVIEVTPLVDVIFLLLLFFVLTTTFVVEENTIDVNLPEAQTGVSETAQQRLVVTIDSNDKIYFNGKNVKINNLNYEIEKYLSTKKTKTAYINADKTAHYGVVVRVMDIFRSYKITDLRISVKELE